MKLCIIGAGYWGNNALRNAMKCKNNGLLSHVEIVDSVPEKAKNLAEKNPGASWSSNLEKSLNVCDAAWVCTPPSSHHKLANICLDAGKHVLVEKPITMWTPHAEQLIDKAESKKLKLAVDHTFLFTPAVRKIKELLPEIGTPLYFDSVRTNLGLFQMDCNVIWDLAPHDLSIMKYLLFQKNRNTKNIVQCTCRGSAHYNSYEDIAYINYLFGPDKFIANFHLSWLSPIKIRRVIIGGAKKMLVWDDMEPIDKIKVYDKAIETNISREKMGEILIKYRLGDYYVPQLDNYEALYEMLKNFILYCKNEKSEISTGIDGHDVVQLIQMAQSSLSNSYVESGVNKC